MTLLLIKMVHWFSLWCLYPGFLCFSADNILGDDNILLSLLLYDIKWYASYQLIMKTYNLTRWDIYHFTFNSVSIPFSSFLFHIKWLHMHFYRPYIQQWLCAWPFSFRLYIYSFLLCSTTSISFLYNCRFSLPFFICFCPVQSMSSCWRTTT
jgi:hypothetical protein